jgi:hypothetical protein
MRSTALAILRGSVLIVGVLVWFTLFACTPNAKAPKRDLVDCYAKALEPVAGEVFDSVQLAHDLVAGKADLGALLHNLQVTEAEAASVLKSVRACLVPPGVAPDAGTAS